MATFSFKATTASLQKDNNKFVPFPNVAYNIISNQAPGAVFDNSSTLTIPRKGTYALSVKLVPGGADAHETPVTDCEIVVNGGGTFKRGRGPEIVMSGVETPLVLNERKTCARVVLPLDEGQRVCVQYSGANMDLLTEGVFSVCCLAAATI